MKAEQDDLKERIELDDHIDPIHQCVKPAEGIVEFATYNGAFIKKKDPICSIRFDQAASQKHLDLGTQTDHLFVLLFRKARFRPSDKLR